jgi:hypothetical protein
LITLWLQAVAAVAAALLLEVVGQEDFALVQRCLLLRAVHI